MLTPRQEKAQAVNTLLIAYMITYGQLVYSFVNRPTYNRLPVNCACGRPLVVIEATEETKNRLMQDAQAAHLGIVVCIDPDGHNARPLGSVLTVANEQGGAWVPEPWDLCDIASRACETAEKVTNGRFHEMRGATWALVLDPVAEPAFRLNQES